MFAKSFILASALWFALTYSASIDISNKPTDVKVASTSGPSKTNDVPHNIKQLLSMRGDRGSKSSEEEKRVTDSENEFPDAEKQSQIIRDKTQIIRDKTHVSYSENESTDAFKKYLERISSMMDESPEAEKHVSDREKDSLDAEKQRQRESPDEEKHVSDSEKESPDEEKQRQSIDKEKHVAV
eukprot:Pgem_evm1s4363